METLLGQNQAEARDAACWQLGWPGSLIPGKGGTPRQLLLWGPQFYPFLPYPEKLPGASLSPTPKVILIPGGSLAPS